MSRGLVYVELDDEKKIIRICRKAPFRMWPPPNGRTFSQVPRAYAVSKIRRQIVERAKNRCEWCGIWVGNIGHMHEVKLRSQGGEISLDNGVYLCQPCHIGPRGVHK